MPNPHKLEHSRGTSWEYTYRVRGRRVRKRTRTKAEAVQGLALAPGRTASGSIVVPADGRITLAAYSEQWLAGRRIRYSTRVSYESQLRRWVLPALGDRPLTSLTRQDVLAFVAKLDSSGLAPRTGNGTYRVLATHPAPRRPGGGLRLSRPAPHLRLQPLRRRRPRPHRPGPARPQVDRRDHGHLRAPVPRRSRADQPGPRGAVRARSHVAAPSTMRPYGAVASERALLPAAGPRARLSPLTPGGTRHHEPARETGERVDAGAPTGHSEPCGSPSVRSARRPDPLGHRRAARPRADVRR